MTGIVVRRFSITDLDNVLQIERSSFASDAYTESRFQSLYRRHPDGFLLAEMSGRVVGYVIGYISRGTGQIDSIAIAPEFRKLGIGKMLVGTIVEKFQKEGVKVVRLEVSVANKAAVRFYQELGFRIAKTVKNYYRDRKDAFVMARNTLSDKLGATDEYLRGNAM